MSKMQAEFLLPGQSTDEFATAFSAMETRHQLFLVEESPALPCCKCGREQKELRAYHAFGAIILCPCGNAGDWVDGVKFQTEQRAAICEWNRLQESKTVQVLVMKPAA